MAEVCIGLDVMAVRADDLEVVVIVATVIGQRNDMVDLCALLQSTVALALLAQAAIALEYPLSDGHPSAASYALSHLFSSQPLRICRLSTVRYGMRSNAYRPVLLMPVIKMQKAPRIL